jgi:hypothetical protein
MRARDQSAHQVFGYLTDADEIAPGRDLSTQLADHYAYVGAHDPDADGGVVQRLVAFAEHDDRAAVRAAQTHDDTYATAELARDGGLGTVTRTRRAQVADDTHGEAELLDGLDGGALDDTKAEFAARYHRDLLAAPDADARAAMIAFARLSGDDRDPDLIARSDMSRDELRLDNLRQFGARSDRAPAFEVQLQREEREHSRSGALEIHDRAHEFLGGNAGTEQLADDAIAATDAQLSPATNPLGLGRHLRDDVSRRDFDRTDRGAIDAQDAQRREKLALAQRSGNAIDTLTQVASLVTLQPELMLLTEAAGGAIKMATKSSTAGHDYSPHDDLVDIGRDLRSTGLMLGGFHVAGKLLGALGEAVRTGTIGVDTAEAIAKNAGGTAGGVSAASGGAGGAGGAGAGTAAVGAPGLDAARGAVADETAKASGAPESASKGEHAAVDVAEQGAPEAEAPASASGEEAPGRADEAVAPNSASSMGNGGAPEEGLPSADRHIGGPDTTASPSAAAGVDATPGIPWDPDAASELRQQMTKYVSHNKRRMIDDAMKRLEASPEGPELLQLMSDPRVQAAPGFETNVEKLTSKSGVVRHGLVGEMRETQYVLDHEAAEGQELMLEQKSKDTEVGQPGHYDADVVLRDADGDIDLAVQVYRPTSKNLGNVLDTAQDKALDQIANAPATSRRLVVQLDNNTVDELAAYEDEMKDFARENDIEVDIVLSDGVRVRYRPDKKEP